MNKIFKIIAIVYFCSLVFCKDSFCQYNLIPNPSFEVYDTCPPGPGYLRYALPWKSPMNSSPDFHNSCSNNASGVPQNFHGFQYAHSGVGYGGIISYAINPQGLPSNGREYLHSPLIDSLVAGKIYFVRFYVSPADSCKYITNDIAAYFSSQEIDTIITPFAPLPFQPQIQNTQANNINNPNIWTEVSGVFTANGGEKYITIGNFHDGSNTIATFTGWGNIPFLVYAVHYVDDVLVTPLDSLTGISNQLQIAELKPTISFSNNAINISSEIGIIECFIYNELGQLVYQNKNSELTCLQIITFEFNTGIFFIQVKLKNRIKYNFKYFKQ